MRVHHLLLVNSFLFYFFFFDRQESKDSVCGFIMYHHEILIEKEREEGLEKIKTVLHWVSPHFLLPRTVFDKDTEAHTGYVTC